MAAVTMLLYCCSWFMIGSQIKILMMILAGMLYNQKQDNRTVMIFADEADNVNVIKQLNILKADAEGVKERDIVIKVITHSDASMQNYKSWHVANNQFTVVLIGKDNGEKLRSHNPVPLVKLFDLIDSMPMRQQEVKYKQ